MLLVVLTLAGCASDPVISTVVQKVEVPISVPCKTTVPTMPDFNFEKLTPEQDVFEKSKALLADRKLHIGYEGELLAALKSCM